MPERPSPDTLPIEPPSPWIDRLTLWLTLIGTTSTLFQTFFAYQALDPKDRSFWKAGNILFAYGLAYLLPVAIVYLAINVYRERTRARSKPVLHADSLVIREENLSGRDSDYEDFHTRYLGAHDLIFLIGKTGVGKTWFSEKVLAPRLRADPLYLPLFVNLRVQEWQKRPLRALQRELDRWNPVSVEDVDQGISIRVLLSRLNRVIAHTQRTPVLILDQFDDYSFLNRDKLFLHGQPLSPKALCAANDFWSFVHSALQRGKLKCVIVAHDEFSQLSSVAFAAIPTATYILSGLTEASARKVVHDVLLAANRTSELSERCAGLRDAIILDLLRHDEASVLPFEMKVALKAVPLLPALDAESFWRAGALDGLENRWIRKEIAKSASARAAPFVTRALLAMIDGGNRKAASNTLAVLAAKLHLNAEESAMLQSALVHLDRAGIVRARQQDSAGEEAWELDHEYLVRPIFSLDSPRNLLEQDLIKRSRGFATPGRSVSRKQDLLSLSELWTVARFALRKEISLLNYRQLLFVSVYRQLASAKVLLAFLLIIGAIVVFSVSRNVAREGIVASLRSSILVPGDVAFRANALWFLSRSEDDIKRRVLSRSLGANAGPIESAVLPDLAQAIGGLRGGAHPIIQISLEQSCYQAPYLSQFHFGACASLIFVTRSTSTPAIRFLTRAQTDQDLTAAADAAERMPPSAVPDVRREFVPFARQAIFSLLAKGNPSNATLNAVNHLGCLVASVLPANEAIGFAETLFEAPQFVDPRWTPSLLTVVEMLPIVLSEKMEARLLEALLATAEKPVAAPLPYLSTHMPSLRLRLAPHRRVAFIARLTGSTKDPRLDSEVQKRAMTFASVLVDPTDQAFLPIVVNELELCELELAQGFAPQSLLRLRNLARFGTLTSPDAQKRLRRILNTLISSPVNRNSPFAGPVPYLLLDFVQLASPARNSPPSSEMPLKLLLAMLPPPERTSTAGELLRRAANQRGTTQELVSRIQLGVAGAVASAEVSDSSRFCKAVEDRLSSVLEFDLRPWLFMALDDCALRDPLLAQRLGTEHYERQKSLVLEDYNRQDFNSQRRIALGVALALTARRLSPAHASSELAVWKRLALEGNASSCSHFWGFTSDENLPDLVDVLRWPTCHLDDRMTLAALWHGSYFSSGETTPPRQAVVALDALLVASQSRNIPLEGPTLFPAPIQERLAKIRRLSR